MRRRIVFSCFLVMSLFLFVTVAFANGSIRIFWVTDNHLKYSDKVLEDRLLWFITETQQEKPDIVIHTGDAIDGKRGRQIALDEIDRFFFFWYQIPESVKTIFVPGNRDIGSLYETVEEDWLAYTGNIEKTAGSYFNRIDDFDMYGVKVRFVSIGDFSQTLDTETLYDWLSEALQVTGFHTIFVLSHSALFYETVTEILKTGLQQNIPVYFLHGHEHGGRGMTLQEEDAGITIQRYLLGGLQDGYYGAVQTIFQKVLPFMVQPPFYEEILIDKTGIRVHRTVYP